MQAHDKRNPVYNKPVVLLMDERSWSASEWAIMTLRVAPNVVVIGSPSIGADGNVVFLPLPGGNTVTFTGLGVFTPDYGQTQRVGLTPDIHVERTVQGVREGRDEPMEAAIRHIMGN